MLHPTPNIPNLKYYPDWVSSASLDVGREIWSCLNLLYHPRVTCTFLNKDRGGGVGEVQGKIEETGIEEEGDIVIGI